MTTPLTKGIIRATTRPSNLIAAQWDPVNSNQVANILGFISEYFPDQYTLGLTDNHEVDEYKALKIVPNDPSESPIFAFRGDWIFIDHFDGLNVMSPDAFDDHATYEGHLYDPDQGSLF